MKIIHAYLLILISCFFFSCSENKELSNNESLTGTLEKSYVNFFFPSMINLPGNLFFECKISNQTKDTASFEFNFDFYDEEKINKLFLVTEGDDSLNLYLRYVINRNFRVLPGKTESVDFYIDEGRELFKKSGIDNYYMFQDSLAFVVDRIIYKFSEDSVFTIRKKDKLDFTIEHRVSIYTTQGEGIKN